MPIEVANQCPFCLSVNTTRVTEEAFNNWQDGMFAQDAFPYHSTEEREWIISGICNDCWPKVSDPEEAEEAEEPELSAMSVLLANVEELLAERGYIDCDVSDEVFDDIVELLLENYNVTIKD
tara:strand:+ start:143 stop:508 length:366 start_codon:yes stop_codon:yes gene_type:complete